MSSSRQEADTDFVLWVLVGVALELFFLIPTMGYFSNWLQPFPICTYSQYCPSFPIHELLVPFLVLYFVIPIPYCTLVSCRLKPKKIISPVGIGVWTVMIAGLLVEVMLPSAKILTNASAQGWLLVLLIFAVSWMMSFLLLILIGFGQALIVRWVVGLSDNPPYHVTYRVNADIARVRETVLSDTFRPWGFKAVDHKPELVLKSRMFLMPRTDILIIIEDSGNGWTRIHGTAYMEDLYEIREQEYATTRLGRVINDIVGDLNVVKGEPFIDEHLRALAAGYVSQHTRTKFSVIQDKLRGWSTVLGHMEPSYRTALYGIVAMWFLTDALIGLLRLYGVEFDATLALIESNPIFFLAVVLDLLVPARISGKSRTV